MEWATTETEINKLRNAAQINNILYDVCVQCVLSVANKREYLLLSVLDTGQGITSKYFNIDL